MAKIKTIHAHKDELHACGMALLEILLENNRKFTGDDCVTLNIPVIMPDESRHNITIAILEGDESKDQNT